MSVTTKRHSPEQVVRKLRQADRVLAGVSTQTFYRWRNQYGGLKAEDAKRL